MPGRQAGDLPLLRTAVMATSDDTLAHVGALLAIGRRGIMDGEEDFQQVAT
jgi:hypothetical protein